MFNLGKHDAKFVDPEFYVDPLDERFTGISQELVITPLLVGAALMAGATAYSGYESAQASRRQAEALRRQAEETRQASLREVEQMRSAAAQRAKEFQSEIEQSRAATAESARQADVARQTAERQIAQQRTASMLTIQQQQLQSAIQQQQKASSLGIAPRRRVGTPAAMRTNLEIQSPLTGGIGTGTPNATGGLNV